MVNHQAEIIAYNDDWKLMMLTSLPMLLLLLLMRKQKQGSRRIERACGGDGLSGRTKTRIGNHVYRALMF